MFEECTSPTSQSKVLAALKPLSIICMAISLLLHRCYIATKFDVFLDEIRDKLPTKNELIRPINGLY